MKSEKASIAIRYCCYVDTGGAPIGLNRPHMFRAHFDSGKLCIFFPANFGDHDRMCCWLAFSICKFKMEERLYLEEKGEGGGPSCVHLPHSWLQDVHPQIFWENPGWVSVEILHRSFSSETRHWKCWLYYGTLDLFILCPYLVTMQTLLEIGARKNLAELDIQLLDWAARVQKRKLWLLVSENIAQSQCMHPQNARQKGHANNASHSSCMTQTLPDLGCTASSKMTLHRSSLSCNIVPWMN